MLLSVSRSGLLSNLQRHERRTRELSRALLGALILWGQFEGSAQEAYVFAVRALVAVTKPKAKPTMWANSTSICEVQPLCEVLRWCTY